MPRTSKAVASYATECTVGRDERAWIEPLFGCGMFEVRIPDLIGSIHAGSPIRAIARSTVVGGLAIVRRERATGLQRDHTRDLDRCQPSNANSFAECQRKSSREAMADVEVTPAHLSVHAVCV